MRAGPSPIRQLTMADVASERILPTPNFVGQHKARGTLPFAVLEKHADKGPLPGLQLFALAELPGQSKDSALGSLQHYIYKYF